MSKISDLSLSAVFFQTSNAPKLVYFSATLYPALGAYDYPPDPLVGWGGGHPGPSPLDAFGVSIYFQQTKKGEQKSFVSPPLYLSLSHYHHQDMFTSL